MNEIALFFGDIRSVLHIFFFSEIRWQRGGLDVSSSGGRTLSGIGGELLLWPAEQADAGMYSCRVTAPSGQYAQKNIQIFVRSKYAQPRPIHIVDDDRIFSP